MHRHHASQSSRAGFTLVELLVVITIVTVLAVLIFTGTRRVMEGAHQAKTVRQMRDIGAAVTMWAQEHNLGEPMYFANGSGDYAEEGALAGKNPLLSPGNPAKLLYAKNDSAASYVSTHEVFFSSLTTFPVPTAKDYDPTQPTGSKPWGTYAWYYPSTTSLTQRQLSAMAGFGVTKISREARDNLIMANDYRGPIKPRFKPHYHALFRDGSVKHIGDSATKWTAWLRGEND
jgi:prepilin-type N-terminal cleavage/methylation domain-containing protein